MSNNLWVVPSSDLQNSVKDKNEEQIRKIEKMVEKVLNKCTEKNLVDETKEKNRYNQPISDSCIVKHYALESGLHIYRAGNNNQFVITDNDCIDVHYNETNKGGAYETLPLFNPDDERRLAPDDGTYICGCNAFLNGYKEFLQMISKNDGKTELEKTAFRDYELSPETKLPTGNKGPLVISAQKTENEEVIKKFDELIKMMENEISIEQER